MAERTLIRQEDVSMAAGFRILREVSRIMGSSLELRWVFEQVMKLLAERLGIERTRLVILDDATGTLRVETAHGMTPEEQSRGVYAIGEGITGRVFETGKPRVVQDVRDDPDYLDRTSDRKSKDEPYSFICLPVQSEGRTIGVLSADKRFTDEKSLKRDYRILTIVTAMISQTLRINGLVRQGKEELINELAELRKTMHDRYSFSNIVGSSQPMLEVFRTVDQVARTRATVLLIGGTGTGKEMIAKALHFNSDRAENPFIRVNCGALSGQLLESELFGHVKGAFTGAVSDKIGRFGAANGGTLFLDEVATMELPLQVKLLRVLQEREFERVGDYRTMSTDVRIVAASNTDLADEVKAGRFREDLYYRLNVVEIRLPALSARRDDIPMLIDHFLDKYNEENGKNLRMMSRDLMNLLMRYAWPGNVRELENTIERAVVLSRDEQFTEDLLPLSIRSFSQQGRPAAPVDSPEELTHRLVCQAMDEPQIGEDDSIWNRVSNTMERALIEEALNRCDGVKIKAADYLGINRNTLNKKYNDLGIGQKLQPAT